MTPCEFKAWFEGYCEGIEGDPTPAQWARVREKVAEISEPVQFVPWTQTPFMLSNPSIGPIGPIGPIAPVDPFNNGSPYTSISYSHQQ